MPASTLESRPRDVLIFYLTGNPGMIGYYPPFLEELNQLLATSTAASHPVRSISKSAADDEEPPPTYESATARKFYYYASSLRGYDTDPSLAPTIVTNLPDYPIAEKLAARPPVTRNTVLIDEQTEFKVSEIEDVVSSQKEAGRDLDVVIVGHSMGCYIILDMIKHLQSRSKIRQPLGSILLFPTVMEIADSESGRSLGRVLCLPGFTDFGQWLINFVLFILPQWLVMWILVNVANHPPPNGSVTTYALLRTPGLIRQTIALARDEMTVISTDKWDESIWGASHLPNSPKLIFYFAAWDHWVADRTREELIKLRCRKKGSNWGPQMIVDEGDVGHAFCFGHSQYVAARCVPWVLEMLEDSPMDEKKETKKDVKRAFAISGTEAVSTSNDITKPQGNGIKHVPAMDTREAVQV